MTTLRQAAQQALEVLEFMADEWGFTQKANRPERWQAIDALRAALAQQEQEQEDVAQRLNSRHDAAKLLEERRQELSQELAAARTGGGNLPPPLASRAGAAAEREKVAHWMRSMGYATGHGDTIEDLLDHLGTQISEGLEVEVLMERAACADICYQHASVEGIAQRCAEQIRARGKT